MNKRVLRKFIYDALDEDLGDGDHSSMACIPPEAKGKAALLVKESGVLAGVEVAMSIFREVEPDIKIEQFLSDGDCIKPGDIAFTVEGTVWTLLKTERLALNVMQRMSGIATRTRQYVDQLKGLHTRILDTRKTTPGMRFLEKEAVKIGGGKNHRFGLFDMIMLKDNHIDFAGGIEKAILSANNYINKAGKNLKIEVEVRNMKELHEVLRVGQVNRIMLDNFDVPTTREAVALIKGRFETESSGAITLETIRAYAETGVDYISVGALTHHIKSLDLSLKAID